MTDIGTSEKQLETLSLVIGIRGEHVRYDAQRAAWGAADRSLRRGLGLRGCGPESLA